MNERIKLLAEQATSYKEGDTEGKHDIEVFDKEKFALLIVQECLDTVERCVEGFGSRNEDILYGGQRSLGFVYLWIQARFSLGPYQDEEAWPKKENWEILHKVERLKNERTQHSPAS